MSQPEGISVCLIAKNCAQPLKECLQSITPFLRPELGDELLVVDTGSTDNTPDVAVECGATLYRHPELNVSGMLDLVKEYIPDYAKMCSEDTQFSDGFLSSFSAARELAYSLAKNDLKFWLDSDDIITGDVKFLREACTREFCGKETSLGRIIFMQYDYCFEPDGTCNTVLWRERICRGSEYIWRGACHESLVPRPGTNIDLRRIDSNICKITHKHGRPHIYSDIRNYAIMRKALKDETWTDPRILYYLGHAARGLAQNSQNSPYLIEAIEWYQKALKRSGSRDDRSSMLLNIAYIYVMFGRPAKAMNWFFEAIKVWPSEPRAYYGIAQCFHELRRYAEAIAWFQIGDLFPPPDHITAVDPLSFAYIPMFSRAQCFKKLNRFDEAVHAAKLVLQMRPNHAAARALIQEIEITANRERVKNAVGGTMSLAFSPVAAKQILHLLKPEVRKEFKEFQLETFATPPRKSITFLCNNTVETWDQDDLDGKGLGGSEKMIVMLARALADRGWAVDVYGNPDQARAYKDFNGVVYRPIESFNISFPRDVVVLWRALNLLSAPIQARKIFVDLHDVTPDFQLTPEQHKKCSGIFFKSKFHASFAPSLDGKAIISRNAVDLSTLGSGPRNLNKVVWCSSGDRGLLGALRAWEVLLKSPALKSQPELHVFYGFTPLYLEKAITQEYQSFYDEGCDRHMLEYMEECFDMMDRLKVKYYYRVGHKAIMQHLSEANIWLYPTEFPEISCMSAMEAQCSGAIPVCSHFGALNETVQFGCEVACRNTPQIASALLHVLSNDLDPHRQEMMESSRKRFDLQSLVDSVEQEFTK